MIHEAFLNYRLLLWGGLILELRIDFATVIITKRENKSSIFDWEWDQDTVYLWKVLEQIIMEQLCKDINFLSVIFTFIFTDNWNKMLAMSESNLPSPMIKSSYQKSSASIPLHLATIVYQILRFSLV